MLLPEGKTEEQANEVYQNYNFRHKYDQSLSITKYQQQVRHFMCFTVMCFTGIFSATFQKIQKFLDLARYVVINVIVILGKTLGHIGFELVMPPPQRDLLADVTIQNILTFKLEY